MHKSNTKKIWISIVAITLVAAGVGLFYFQDWIKAYYNNFTTNHYRYGDPIEINERDISILNYANLPLHRIAKSEGNYVELLSEDISGNKMKQYHVNYIGTYVGYKLITVKDKNGQNIIVRAYAIKPDTRILEPNPKSTGPKPGYQYIDNNYYIFWIDILK